MTKTIGIVCAACLAIVVVAAIAINARVKALYAPGESSVELNYEFSIADSDHDGKISQTEFDHFVELRQALDESNGELMINESGELEIADKFAHDPVKRAEFEQRQHMKD